MSDQPSEPSENDEDLSPLLLVVLLPAGVLYLLCSLVFGLGDGVAFLVAMAAWLPLFGLPLPS